MGIGYFMEKYQEYLDEAEVKGRAEGRTIGMAEGRLAVLMALYYKGRISLNDAAECMGESVDGIRALFLVDYYDSPLK